ncbi:hypothetical protein FFLO_00451 [Filobasidium floriforme]|uniref:K Homology domain-containing protein n=1 Tax=Filobasidium floriforme TaxID=5210 RepID=A0A8K0JRY6_9TREE|nr:cytoplasm protein [Filobasidium floriforme]KAG7575287.1 hypothetical protein FFLO_00451 [Filobasidium floriforme]KAH8078921.1 cytoplasm protein [Filobasidium floriforme]
MPVPTSPEQGDNVDQTPADLSEFPGEDGQGAISIRALISTKEAGIIIGQQGKTVAGIRNENEVKAGVSKVVQGVQDRVLSITGQVENVSKAFAQVAKTLLETPLADPEHLPSNAFTSMRLLISHNLMGSIIGKSGATIKQIQDASGARMVASKEMLPQSTERVVEIQGNVEAIKQAVHQIGECLLRDWDRAQGTIYYQPGAAGDQGVLAGGLGAATVTGPTGGIRRASATPAFGGNGERRMSRAAPQLGGDRRRSEGGNGSGQGLPPASLPAAGQGSFGGEVDPNLRTQSISIPSDMVGCIIGRAGSKITEIRRLSGSKISIAKTPHDDSGERMFTIVGPPEANEKALFLLYNQLESEKQRRVGATLGEPIQEEI